MKNNLIVITGGPGTGKTTLIEALKENGHICYPEISRQITLEAQKKGIDQLFLDKPLMFSEQLLEGRKKQYVEAQAEETNTIFIDRGIPDILAYMDFIGIDYPDYYDTTSKVYRYSKVFLLPPWEEIYQSDDVRYENFEQAQTLYNHLKSTYSKYSYNLIEVPKAPIEERLDFIKKSIGL